MNEVFETLVRYVMDLILSVMKRKTNQWDSEARKRSAPKREKKDCVIL